MIIARRSVSLSKTYPVMGVFLTFVGLLFSSLSGLVSNASTTGIPASTDATASNTALGVPFLAVPFQALAAIIFSTPVLLLFVYDKNNGVLEYLLSLGMDQRDIFREYLKAAILLAAAVVAMAAVFDLAVGATEGTLGSALQVSTLVVVISFSAVALGTMLMMSFSSLQKQRVGSNQPLGMAVGAFAIIPSYLLPLIFPSIAFWIDLSLAGVIACLALLTFSVSSRLISREKLLP